MASLLTLPKFREFIPSTNNLAVGYKVQTFAAGTSTPLATYSDAALSAPNSNPTVLDANGEAILYAGAGVNYKVQFQDPSGTPLWTVDNVTIAGGSGGGGGGGVSGSEWISTSLTPSFISTTSFSVTGDQRSTFQVGRRLQTTNTGGTLYGTVTASSFGAGITTVTVLNDGANLDAGLSVVNVGIQAPSNRSIPDPSSMRIRGSGVSLSTTVQSFLGASGSPTKDWDNLGEFSGNTFTAAQAGVYQVCAMIGYVTSGVTFSTLPQAQINAAAWTAFAASATINVPTTGQYAFSINGAFKLNAGQTITVSTVAAFSAGTITYNYDMTIARTGA